VALIIAILAVTLASIAAVAMASRQQVDIRRTQNILNLEQANMYLYGGESWAARVLAEDLKQNKTDSFADIWAKQLPPVPVEGGQISGYIRDEQSRFNLNSLLLSANRELARQRYERLLDTLGLGKELVDSLVDWMDGDVNVTLPDGAEDNDYLGNTARAYRTANRPLQDISELLLVKGYSWEVYARLKPYVSAINGPTSINVNTAPKEVIMALAKDLSEAEIESLLEEQKKNGFANLNEFTSQPAFNGKGLSPEGLTVSSQYFLLTSNIMIGRARQQVESLLYREDGGHVIVRLRRPVEH
jgi:general secretion pathway protein K